MSDANIPLLTDIVAEPDAASPGKRPATVGRQPESGVDSRNFTGSADSFVDYSVREEAIADAAITDEEFVVFEADDSRAGDTATHHVPLVDVLHDSMSFDEYEIVPATLHLALEDELPNNSIAIDDAEMVIAELQTHIASHVYELTDELMRAAFADLEARVFRQISTNLRQQLPELIDSVVREHLLERNQRSTEGE